MFLSIWPLFPCSARFWFWLLRVWSVQPHPLTGCFWNSLQSIALCFQLKHTRHRIGKLSLSTMIVCEGSMSALDSRSVLVTHPLLISRLIQNLGSLAWSLAMSTPITSPNDPTMASAWSWCSNGMFRKLTQVGKARLLVFCGLKPSIQLWIKHVPHLDLKADNMRTLLRASLLSPLMMKNPFLTFLLIVNVGHFNFWFNVCIHKRIAWRLGFGPFKLPNQ